VTRPNATSHTSQLSFSCFNLKRCTAGGAYEGLLSAIKDTAYAGGLTSLPS
jgi:hypothetical protein